MKEHIERAASKNSGSLSGWPRKKGIQMLLIAESVCTSQDASVQIKGHEHPQKGQESLMSKRPRIADEACVWNDSRVLAAMTSCQTHHFMQMHHSADRQPSLPKGGKREIHVGHDEAGNKQRQ